MSKLLVAPGSDPYINLAAESLLLREAAEPTLYLWVNSPSVIVGVNQNILKEADAEYLRSNGVSVVRRTTGGGAVYHDLGNLNYSFIIPNSIYSVERQNRVISDALRNFSVEAHFSGRNDLVVGVRKVGGAAYKKSVPNSLHHGTLLVNLDIGAATAALTPAPEKLESKGVDSVKSRIANLSEFSDAVNVATLSPHPYRRELLNWVLRYTGDFLRRTRDEWAERHYSRATPVLLAAVFTASATASFTRGSKESGIM